MIDQTTNPLLSRIKIPGETHSLPSRGLFYRDGELDSSARDGEVHVLPMTTIDEITMRSADLLYTGKAIEEVFKRCIPAVLKPSKLFQKDVDFLLTILRKVTYGDDVEITYTHDCEKAKDNSYHVNIPKLLQQVKTVDPTTIGKKFTVTVANNQEVHICPLRYESMIEMLQLTDKDISIQKRHQMATKFLLNMIEKVDEITDKKLIEQWLTSIPAGWAQHIDQTIKDAQDDWGIDFNVVIQCKDCQQNVKIQAPLNPLFFFT